MPLAIIKEVNLTRIKLDISERCLKERTLSEIIILYLAGWQNCDFVSFYRLRFFAYTSIISPLIKRLQGISSYRPYPWSHFFLQQ